MSIEILEREMGRFLASPAPEVLCLKGKWGIGKTFAWQRYIQVAKSNQGIALERYAFVSLFGVNSTEQLRLSIVESTVPRDRIGEDIDLESTFQHPVHSTQRFLRRVLSKVAYVPGAKDAAALVQQLSFLSVRKQLICLDDLERKGDGLKIKEVLGLASFLKEQRSCKIVLILNDGAFEKAEKDDFTQFFEKTVDSHVQFTPTAEECARIALPGATELDARMRDLCVALGISNIRVIRRIERMAHMLQRILAPFHDRVFQGYLRELVLLGWCKYSEDAPTLEFLRKRRSSLLRREEIKSDDEVKWGARLDDYELGHDYSISSTVQEALDQGFFDEGRLTPEALKLHEGYVAGQSDADFHDAWQIYHSGFGDDEKELVDALNASFRRNARYISPLNANGTFALLKNLGHTALSTELIALYITSRDIETFDERRMFSSNDITDPEFNKAVKSKVGNVVDTREPKEVLLQISRQHGWGRRDVELLSKIDADDYYKMFKTIADSGDLSSVIRTALSFGTTGGTSNAEKTIASRATEALLKIASESTLNRLRVAKYGIRLQKED